MSNTWPYLEKTTLAVHKLFAQDYEVVSVDTWNVFVLSFSILHVLSTFFYTHLLSHYETNLWCFHRHILDIVGEYVWNLQILSIIFSREHNGQISFDNTTYVMTFLPWIFYWGLRSRMSYLLVYFIFIQWDTFKYTTTTHTKRYY